MPAKAGNRLIDSDEVTTLLQSQQQVEVECHGVGLVEATYLVPGG